MNFNDVLLERERKEEGKVPVCRRCSGGMWHDCGSTVLVWVCYKCGHRQDEYTQLEVIEALLRKVLSQVK